MTEAEVETPSTGATRQAARLAARAEQQMPLPDAVVSRQRRRWIARHPRGLYERRGRRFVGEPDKSDRRILQKWTEGGIEFAFHGTKGLRRRRINS